MIDYDEIDDKIIDVVKLLNKIEGIETQYSCEGHKKDNMQWYSGYVTLEAENMSSLHRLLELLSPLRDFVYQDDNGYIYGGLKIEVDLDKNNNTRFTLRFQFPSEKLKDVYIENIEKCLKEEYEGDPLIDMELVKDED